MLRPAAWNCENAKMHSQAFKFGRCQQAAGAANNRLASTAPLRSMRFRPFVAHIESLPGTSRWSSWWAFTVPVVSVIASAVADVDYERCRLGHQSGLVASAKKGKAKGGGSSKSQQEDPEPAPSAANDVGVDLDQLAKKAQIDTARYPDRW
jgi:hypothetical protein